MIIVYILFSMLLMRFLVTVVNLLSRPFLKQKSTSKGQPLVSVLIPARNEEQSIENILNDLNLSDYPNMEIIVCDDQSTDSTSQILQKKRETIKNFDYFTNVTLPSGWVGKNFACYQLAQRANGKYLLFADADVRLNPDAIRKAVIRAQNEQSALLSVFPQQVMKTPQEQKIVPIMNWILLSFLPLIAVRLSWFSSLSAANGQIMLFDATIYRQNQWHQKVYNQNVEDILIARLMKKSGFKTIVLTGNEDFFCRMYTTSNEAIDGFSRNIHQYFGGNRNWMMLFVVISWLRLPVFAIYSQWYLLGISAIMIIAMKIIVSYISHQSISKNMIYHFYHLWYILILSIRNIQVSQQKKFEWKGRVYKI